MGYLAHLIKTGRLGTNQMHFLPPGHAKFSPDAFFDLSRRVFRRLSNDPSHEMKREAASKVASFHTFNKEDEPERVWKDLRTFVEDRYEPVPGINGSYHFCLHRTEQRGIIVRHCAKDESRTTELLMEVAKNKTFIVRTCQIIREAALKILPNSRLSAERSKELLKQVLEYVTYNKQDEWKQFIVKHAPAPLAVATPGRPARPCKRLLRRNPQNIFDE